VGKWESRSDFQGSAAAGFSTTRLATTIHAFRMAGLEVTLYGRFWVTPEGVSEVLGLKWCDVDWEGMRIGIRQSYVYGKPGAVKTPASQRWMPLDPSLAKKLRHHQLRNASPADKDDWVFANPDTGKPYWPGRIQENWLVPAAENVGIGRIGWHTFRHSHSSLLHALGVDLKVQQELLRHADIRTTMNIYTHAVPAALREANSKVVRLVLPAQVA
jgi:integrase